MKLFEKFMEETPCVMLDRKSTTGPMGPEYTWVEGAGFFAAIVKDSTLAARVAEKEGVKEVYTVTIPKGFDLDFHDVFKRVSDGAIFRVTSNTTDSSTPETATFQFAQVNAERWEIPTK